MTRRCPLLATYMALRVLVLLLAGMSLASAASWVTATDCSSAAPPTAYGTPTSDPKTTMSVSTAVSDAPDNGLCPGVLYNVKVVFPNARKFIVAASKGTFAGASAACPNRRMSTAGVTSVGLELTLPCDASGMASITVSSVAVNATSSMGYRKLATNLPILATPSACTMSPCATAATVTNTAAPSQASMTPTTTAASTSASTSASSSKSGQQMTLDFSALFDAKPLTGLGGLAAALQGIGASSTGSTPVTNLTSLVNSLKTVGSLANAVTGTTAARTTAAGTTTTNASMTPPSAMTMPAMALDPTQFLPSLQQIGSLVSTGGGSDILGLLTSFNTIQSAVSNNSSATQAGSVLNALNTVGSMLNPTAASTGNISSSTSSSTTTTSASATSPLKSLIAAGEDVVKNLQAFVPASTNSTPNGGLAAVDLPAILKFVQSVGTFFTKLSAFSTGATGAFSG
ncbi:hypothetical protein COO60DRAFT_1131798 [Scenedesmus sp. NREL 46B-D3]|nr:hypothetical protein COO60DRAFT_1131798 [Scenedesmus sp. NREL 46B-D3]